MDKYSYYHVGEDGWLYTDRLHREGFTTILWDVLRCFDYESRPMHRGHTYHEFGLGRCEVQIDIPSNPEQQRDWMAWSTLAKGSDMDDTLEKVA
jgi:hypothetical protein